MAKTKKKRTKSYSGADAKITRPQVVRISAANRSAPKQWLYERQRLVRPVAMAVLVVAVLVLIIFGLISIFGTSA